MTFGMERPCLLDVKIGRRLYDVDATETKIIKRIHKSEISTSGLLGFRFCGLRTDNLTALHKDQLAALNAVGVSCAISMFFQSAPPKFRTTLKHSFIGLLSNICRTVELSSVQLISCSALLVYDAAYPENVACKLIDFAHSHFHGNYEFYDENFISGMMSFINFISNFDA